MSIRSSDTGLLQKSTSSYRLNITCIKYKYALKNFVFSPLYLNYVDKCGPLLENMSRVYI